MTAVATRASGAAAGLVSVPTTHKGAQCSASDLSARIETDELLQRLGAFSPDPEKTRLARLRRSVGFAARCHGVSKWAHRNDVAVMVTLTYAGSNEQWKPEHLTRFMNHVRNWCARRAVKCRYVWVAELQKRGVIHYHVVVWLPRGLKLPRADKQGWWPHGMTRTEVARFAVPYLLKYLSKETSKTFGSFPDGARIYGVGGLDWSMRRSKRWLGLPSFVQGNGSIFDDWQRRVGGGWISPDGEVFASEFKRVMVGREWALLRVRKHAISLQADGPFCWLSDREAASVLLK